MSKILLIETSSEVCSVGLAENGEIKIVFEEKGGNIHASRAPQFVSQVLDLYDVDAVAVSSGPGSYTGLRIGVSLAKGIAYGKKIPLIAVPTLDAMASYIASVFPLEDKAIVLPTVDARRREIYTAAYNHKGMRLTDVKPVIIEPDSFNEFAPAKLYIAGNAARKTFENVNYENKHIINVVPGVKNMVEIACDKFARSAFEDVAYFEPFYLKQFLITKPKKKLL